MFPAGLGVVGEVMQLVDFDKSTRENRVQALDKESGLPVWTVDVMDFDPEARERTFKVKISAREVPVLPPAVAGLPVRPVYLEGMTVTPYLKEGGPRPKIAYSIRAQGLAQARRQPAPGAADSKAA